LSRAGGEKKSVASPARKRRTRPDGERSYRAIVDGAARLATTEGLAGLSIGRLAQEIGMSKGGLYAHFNSKQELQLAAVAAAEDVYSAEVVAPATEVAEGLERVRELCERYLSYVERGVFPGGCFFASTAAEWDTRAGPVRDRVRAVLTDWIHLLETNVRTAQDHGDLDSDLDPGQLTFEINALLHEANGHYLLFRDRAVLERARLAIDDRLARARA
jgi:AcrR family transcriptional regulator